MQYHHKYLRKRTGDTWEAAYYYIDPVTKEKKIVHHTIEAQSKKIARQLRDEDRCEPEMQGCKPKPKITVAQLLDEYVECKDHSGTIEKSSVKDCIYNSNFIKKYISSRFPYSLHFRA